MTGSIGRITDVDAVFYGDEAIMQGHPAVAAHHGAAEQGDLRAEVLGFLS